MSNDEGLNTSLCINHEEINYDNTNIMVNENDDYNVNKQVSIDNDKQSYINEKEIVHNLPNCFDDNLNSKNR